MQIKMNKRKCKSCGLQFQKVRPLQNTCSIPCAIEHANKLKIANKRTEDRLERVKTKKAIEAIKPWQKWFNECKTIAQRYARIRDRDDGCISCTKDKNWWGQWHGSHFRPAGNFKAVALNLMNIHKSCSECNNHKSGNGVEYNDRLIVKIGQDKVHWLKSQTQPYRHSIEYLKRYKQVMGKRLRRLEKRINN
jgi:hypothetical protein